MKANVKFIKDHPSGIASGKEATLEADHALRLHEGGFVEVQDHENVKKAFEEEVANRNKAVKERLDQLKSKQQKEEETKQKERDKIKEGKEAKRHERMSTDDIKSDKPVKKQGGKK